MEIEKTSAVGTKHLPYTEELWKIPGYRARYNTQDCTGSCAVLLDRVGHMEFPNSFAMCFNLAFQVHWAHNRHGRSLRQNSDCKSAGVQGAYERVIYLHTYS